jgi:hypothetical protein
MACYPASYENGMNTRFYVDSNAMTAGGQSAAPTWVPISGELDAKMTVKPITVDATNKDSPAGAVMAVGYDWTMGANCQWNATDAGQVLIRNSPQQLELRRVAFKPNGATAGYYGYAAIQWDVDATNRAIVKLTLTITGCGVLTYA